MIIPFPTSRSELVTHGRHLRAVREARGLELAALAQAANLSAEALLLAEEGRAELSASQHFGLETALHVPMGFLFAHQADVSGLRRL